MERIPSGIYMVLNLLNGKRYIGSAVNLEGRRRIHFRKLERGIHRNSHLQSAYNKYGRNVFGWEVLEYVEDIQTLLSREDIFLKMYWPTGLLYNNCPVAGSQLGCRHTEEWCHERSKISMKLWRDPKYRSNQLNTNPMLQKGKYVSAETKQKKSQAMLKRWENSEYRQKLFTIFQSFEYRQKLSEAHKGKEYSAETRQKMSDARKEWWARRKHAEHLLMLAQLVAVLQKRLVCLTTITDLKEGIAA